MSAPVVDVSALSVRYGRREVLAGVSLQVQAGSVCALLGRNGAGKSSLVRCLLGLQQPQGGHARLFGQDVWSHRARLLARVGVVPEEPDAPPEMTARDLIMFSNALYDAFDVASAAARLQRFEVPLTVPFGRLSKGQKGAVMLALALAPSPALLVLDDPTLGLDVVARRALYDELIGDLADRGTTVLVTTHDLSGVEAIADQVAVLREGRLLLDEPLEALKARTRRIRCATGPTWEPFETLAVTVRDWGQEALVTNFSEDRLQAFTARAGGAETEVGAVSLEEMFLALAGSPAAGARS